MRCITPCRLWPKSWESVYQSRPCLTAFQLIYTSKATLFLKVNSQYYIGYLYTHTVLYFPILCLIPLTLHNCNKRVISWNLLQTSHFTRHVWDLCAWPVVKGQNIWRTKTSSKGQCKGQCSVKYSAQHFCAAGLVLDSMSMILLYFHIHETTSELSQSTG